jgi:phosphoribosylglycinamide formyltransferase 1
MKNIAIFASGSGSNAENIARYFEHEENLNIKCIYSNRQDAFVLERARHLGIPSRSFSKDEFYHSGKILDELLGQKIDLIILAGFLWLVPANFLKYFTIINIHPALLPKYGGKGMFGMKVHEAVVSNRDSETGITIHYVNEKYDDGQILFQAKCLVLPNDTPEMVAEKVHQLEYLHFPRVIEELLLK